MNILYYHYTSSKDGQYVHIVDSATGATFERKDKWKTKGHIFYQKEDNQNSI